MIASLLCKQEVLKTSFGLRVQSYIEACEASGTQIRGRYLSNLVSREFDTSAAAGAITSSLELFQLPVPQDSPAALKHWRDKVVYILSQLPAAQRPNEELMSQWIYDTLKKHPLHSHPRSFDAIWSCVELALLEAQHDANAQSIKDDLKKGPSFPKKALPAPKGKDGKAKGDKVLAKDMKGKGPDAKGKGSTPNPKDSNAKKGAALKGKDGGLAGTPGKPTKAPTAEEKAASPCIYHMKGRCMRGDSCPYSHTIRPKAKASPQAASSSHAPVGAKVTAAVAIMSTMSTAAVATSPSTLSLEFVGDTGAGECLGSVEAFRRQGFELPDEFVTQSSQPVTFLTGGGHKSGTKTVGFWSQEFDRVSNVYLLPNCPLALSIGQLCSEGYSFLWSGGSLPMLIPPTTQFDCTVSGPVTQADRVEHHVPVFRLSIDCAYGSPASPSVPAGFSGGGSRPDAPVDEAPIVSDVARPSRVDHHAHDADAVEGAGEIGPEQHDEEVEGIPPNHLLTHLPKSRDCDTCKRAKLYEVPRRRAENMNARLQESRRRLRPTTLKSSRWTTSSFEGKSGFGGSVTPLSLLINSLV